MKTMPHHNGVSDWPVVLASRLAKPLGITGPRGADLLTCRRWSPEDLAEFGVVLDAAMAGGNFAAEWIAVAIQHDPSDLTPCVKGGWARDAYDWLDYHDRRGVGGVAIQAGGIVAMGLREELFYVIARTEGEFVTDAGVWIIRALGSRDSLWPPKDRGRYATAFALEAWFAGTEFA